MSAEEVRCAILIVANAFLWGIVVGQVIQKRLHRSALIREMRRFTAKATKPGPFEVHSYDDRDPEWHLTLNGVLVWRTHWAKNLDGRTLADCLNECVKTNHEDDEQ